MHGVRCTTLLDCPAHRILSALGHVHGKPDDYTRHEAYRKQEREALPGIASLTDDNLYHVRPDDRRRTIRQPEEGEELYTPPSVKLREITIAVWGIVRTMKSNPGGDSSAITVCEYARYGVWNKPNTMLCAQNSQPL
jgi:hypothetical protein